MSCRTTGARSAQQLELLPRFHQPTEVYDFALENRPPTLPARNSPSRVLLMCVGAVLCLVGSYSMITAAAGPVLEHGSTLAHGVSRAVGNAISHANREAEKRATQHREARERFLSKRRLADEPPEPARPAARSPIMLRLAALRGEGAGELDESRVEQFFPSWVLTENRWNEEAVMRDLVLAVAQLAHSATVEHTDDNT